MKRFLLLTCFFIFGVFSVFSEDGNFDGSDGSDAVESQEEKTAPAQVRMVNVFEAGKSSAKDNSPKQILVTETKESADSKNPIVFGARGIMQIGFGELGDICKEGIENYLDATIYVNPGFSGGIAAYCRKVFDSGFGFQGEAGFTGTSLSFYIYDNKNNKFYGDFSFTSFNLSGLVCYKIPLGTSFSIVPLVGLQAGILATEYIESENDIDNFYYFVDTSALVSFVAGATAVIDVFVIDARFNFGINSLLWEGIEVGSFNSFAISAGFEFKL